MIVNHRRTDICHRKSIRTQKVYVIYFSTKAKIHGRISRCSKFPSLSEEYSAQTDPGETHQPDINFQVGRGKVGLDRSGRKCGSGNWAR